MKKRIASFLLALCLLLTACGQKQPEDPVVEDPVDVQQPQEQEEELLAQDEATDGENAEQIADKEETQEEDKKENKEDKKEDPKEETKKEEAKKPAAPKYQPLVKVTADKERVVGAASKGMSAGMEQALLDLADCYYRSVGGLAVQDCSALFSTKAEADWHKAVWYSLIEIRKASLIDLHLVDYGFTLHCSSLKWNGEEEVRLTVTENAVMYFAATSYVPSEQYGTIHTFTLKRTGQDSWLVAEHNSDDNPYYNFSYDKAKGCDKRLSAMLNRLYARQATRGGAGAAVTKTWDHDYNRQAAYNYMQTYIERRNGKWKVYDDLGGNCQNFGSQVLLAGGIPMDEEGSAKWYWKSHSKQNYSWINVGRFMDYAKANTGYGLVSDPYANYYDGKTGDILIMGITDRNHTTVIADTITSGGAVVDYLICSNTSNYRNFPASAYYYTQHWLVRIFGWNDAETEAPETPGGGETPDSGETPGSGETPDSGETPGGGETPDSGETPSGGETPGGGETPDSGETPGGGETPDPDPQPETGDGEESPAA